MLTDKLTLPNLLSGSRLILAPLIAWLILQEHWGLAAVLVMSAVVTDLLDGILARRQQQVTTFGGLLDHLSDAVFVTVLLSTEAYLGIVTPLLPILVVTAFCQYTLDSKALSGQPLRASKLGRYNGILYFVLAGFPIMQEGLSIYLLSDVTFFYASLILCGSSLVSMADRGITLWQLTRR